MLFITNLVEKSELNSTIKVTVLTLPLALWQLWNTERLEALICQFDANQQALGYVTKLLLEYGSILMSIHACLLIVVSVHILALVRDTIRIKGEYTPNQCINT